jgi:hypothetical protein
MSQLKVNTIRHTGASSDAITLATDGTATAKITNNLSNRNKVVNGSMIVSQRNGTSAVTTVNAYNIDRWQNAFSGTIGAYSFSQATDSPDGFGNSYKIDVTTADTSLGSTDVHYFRTAIEGQDIQDFAKGTSSAKKFTLSFYVKTTKTGTYIVNLTDADNSRECSASYTVSDTNWNRYTISFPADTTGAFDNDNAVSLRVLFALSAGSSFQSGTLSTSWAASSDANRLVGQVNLADNTSNDWLITGIQLEVGDTATDFEHRSYGDELARCQRYYYAHISALDSANSTLGLGMYYSSSRAMMYVKFPVSMRTTPTTEITDVSNGYQLWVGGTYDFVDEFHIDTTNAGSVNGCELESDSEASGTTGYSCYVRRYTADTKQFSFSAEL